MTEKEEKIKETEEELKGFAVIEAVANSEGGQKIITSLKKDILSAINEICSKYKEASHQELIAISAKLAERINLVRVFARAGKNKEMSQEELEALLKADS